jgi:hypothetical protein
MLQTGPAPPLAPAPSRPSSPHPGPARPGYGACPGAYAGLGVRVSAWRDCTLAPAACCLEGRAHNRSERAAMASGVLRACRASIRERGLPVVPSHLPPLSQPPALACPSRWAARRPQPPGPPSRTGRSGHSQRRARPRPVLKAMARRAAAAGQKARRALQGGERVCVCVEWRARSFCAGWADGYRSNSASLVASPCASPTTVPARKMTVTRHFAMRVEDRIMAGTYESTELALPQFDHATNQTVFQFDAQHMEELLNLTCTSPCSVFITQPTSPSCLAVFCK